jgi:rubrerythrin
MREQSTMAGDSLTLETVDADGAVREAADRVAGDSRAGFLAKAGMFGGGLLGGGALLGLMAEGAQAQSSSDIAILNFALTLEYLEAAFYAEANKMGALSGETKLFARVVGAHEAAHVAALKQVLGSAAVKKPKFDFRGTTESAAKFKATAQTLEDTGVKAYKGQAPKIKNDTVLAAALAIHSVEARHAAWIREIRGASPAPAAFDTALTKKQVLAAVAGTHFIVARRATGTSGTPPFTG